MKTALPPEVLAEIEAGNPVKAIVLLRMVAGIDLNEARQRVEAHMNGAPAAASTAHAGPLPPDVLSAMGRGKKIEAIRLLREQTGMGLKDAKDAVEAGDPGRAAKAPGEVTDPGFPLWRWVGLALALCLVYYLMRDAL